jgi:hypothetical protein
MVYQKKTGHKIKWLASVLLAGAVVIGTRCVHDSSAGAGAAMRLNGMNLSSEFTQSARKYLQTDCLNSPMLYSNPIVGRGLSKPKMLSFLFGGGIKFTFTAPVFGADDPANYTVVYSDSNFNAIKGKVLDISRGNSADQINPVYILTFSGDIPDTGSVSIWVNNIVDSCGVQLPPLGPFRYVIVPSTTPVVQVMTISPGGISGTTPPLTQYDIYISQTLHDANFALSLVNADGTLTPVPTTCSPQVQGFCQGDHISITSSMGFQRGTYQATLSGSTSGGPPLAPYTWTFFVETPPTGPFTLSRLSPGSDETDVRLDQQITFAFNQDVQESGMSITLEPALTPNSETPPISVGILTANSKTLSTIPVGLVCKPGKAPQSVSSCTLTPKNILEPATSYTFRLTGAKSISGVAMKNYASSFTTGPYITSLNKYGGYDSWRSLANPSNGVVFKAKADNDIYLAFSSTPTDNIAYEIVFGGWGNTRSVLRRSAHNNEVAAVSRGISNPNQEAYYWATKDALTLTIAFGEGKIPGVNTLLTWKDPNYIRDAQYFSFSSWGPAIEYSEISPIYFSNGQYGTYTNWSEAWKMPSSSGALVFKAIANNDIHVAFSNVQGISNPMYEIVIGGWGNTSSVIRRASQGMAFAMDARGMSTPGQQGYFWVTKNAATSTIAFGEGKNPGVNPITIWTDPYFLADAGYFSFSSWNSPIYFSDVQAIPYP